MKMDEMKAMKSVAPALALALVILGAAGCKKDGVQAPGDLPYAITVTPPAEGRMGEPLAARIKVEPRGKYKMNLDYPTKLEVQGPMGAAPMRQVLRKGEAVSYNERELVMAPVATLGKGGAHKFNGTLSFSVCTEALCELKSEKLSWTVKVKE